jgi:hypothetical protein
VFDDQIVRRIVAAANGVLDSAKEMPSAASVPGMSGKELGALLAFGSCETRNRWRRLLVVGEKPMHTHISKSERPFARVSRIIIRATEHVVGHATA